MSYKHITKKERNCIEQMLRMNHSLNQIAKELKRSPSTIAREIKRNRTQTSKRNSFNKKHPDNNCANASICIVNRLCVECDGPYNSCRQCMRCNAVCAHYEPLYCQRRDSSPWCCNGCVERRNCKIVKYDYIAKDAHNYATKKLTQSRSGISFSDEEIEFINNLFSPLLKKGQSVSHVFMNHADEIPCSERSIYTLIRAGLLDANLFDLPRTLQRKPYRKRPERKVDRQCYLGRTYKDFLTWKEENIGASVVEMDTVEGPKSAKKVVLTLKWVRSGFLMAFLLERQTTAQVNAVFKAMKKTLGKTFFMQLFPVLLTDRGSEFTNPAEIEQYEGEIWTNVFFCDAQKPQQKPHVENEHTMLRRKLPKGMSFDELTQEDIQIILSHVNSYKRTSKNEKSPIELFAFAYGQEVLDYFQVNEIQADEINLKPYIKEK